MIISLIKRHRLALEAAVYSSIGSLKRLKRNSSVPRSDGVKETKPDITTATEVAFFPRYSVVNKSWRGEKKQRRSDRVEKTVRSEKAEMTKKEKSKKKTEGKVDKAATVTEEMNKTSPSRNISKSSLYEIISTMKMKASVKAEPRQVEEKKTDGGQTSFYYHQGGNVSSASSKYDLTIARNNNKNNVQVQVHQPNYVTLKTQKAEVNVEVETNPKSSSPQPLLSNTAEKIYSFNSLREKCRKMIANSKPFQQSKTKL